MDANDPRRTDDIEPIVPDLSPGARPDGGPARRSSRPARPPERPPRTDYASPYTRDEEELLPLVPDLR